MPNLDDLIKTKLDVDVTVDRDADFVGTGVPVGTATISRGGEDYGVTTADVTDKTRGRALANSSWLMNSIGKNRGSIAAMAAKNTFEFPVFVSSSLSLNHATATCAVLEHVYANFLQCAIAQDPVVTQYAYSKGQALEKFKSNTGGYAEMCEIPCMADSVHTVIEAGDVVAQFDLAALPERMMDQVIEMVNHEPLSEFDHFFTEARIQRTGTTHHTIDRATGKTIQVRGNDHDGYVDANGNEYDADDVWARNVTGTELTGTDKDSDDEENEFKRQRNQREEDRLDLERQKNTRDTARLGLEKKKNEREARSTTLKNIRAGGKVGSAIGAVTDIVSGAARATSDVTNAINNIRDHKTNIENTKAQTDQFKTGAEKNRTDIEKSRLDMDKTRLDIANYNEKRINDINKQTKAPELLDQSKVAKLNTLAPLMMTVNLQVIDAQGHIQVIETMVGVKTRCHYVDASMFPEVAEFPVKTMDKIGRKIKWKAGELKFGRDLVWQKREKKQTAFDKLDQNRRWYRRLYELSQRKGDALAARATKSGGKGLKGLHSFISKREEYGLLPNATIVMTKNDIDNVKTSVNIDLLNDSVAAKFCDDMFLISFVVINEDAESVSIMIPDQGRSFDVQSMASINKTMANLDTVGAKTNEMFKLLK